MDYRGEMAPARISVTEAELDAVLAVVHDCAEAPDAAAYRERALTGVRRLVRCEVATLNEVDPVAGSWQVWGDPPEALFAGYDEVVVRHADRNPLMRHQLRERDGRARTISDFTTRLGFLRQDTADSVYGRLGLEDTVAISFPGWAGWSASRCRTGGSGSPTATVRSWTWSVPTSSSPGARWRPGR